MSSLSKEQERETNGRSDDGKIPTLEDTTSLDDAWDVLIRLAGSGVVYDFARPNQPASSSSECCYGGHDRGVRGVDES